MKFGTLLIVIAIAPVFAFAKAACEPIRVGYLDQDRPPYWLGTGKVVPPRPGAGAELVRRFAASAGCEASLKRVPVLRIKPALASGEVDFAPMDSSAEATPGIVFPRDKSNKIDSARSIPVYIVVFVLRADHVPQDAEPRQYFQGRAIGVTLGSSYRNRIQQVGLKVDGGALDIASNLEKLRLHRIDGFAVSVVSPNDMDSYVATKYKGTIVRMRKPLFADRLWLATSQRYYTEHRDQVEKMWMWLASSGQREFSTLLKDYSDGQ